MKSLEFWSRPSRARELKLLAVVRGEGVCGSRPSRARELKPTDPAVRACLDEGRAPRGRVS